METIKKIVRVTVEKEYEIELPVSHLNLADWSADLWPISEVDEIFKFAAEMAAQGVVERDVDGLGRFTEAFQERDRRSESTFLELFSDISATVVDSDDN